MQRILILNATVINEGRIRQADLYIKDGRIEQIGTSLSSLPADRTIDASGQHLFPGMIDDQVHFREPGLTHKGNIYTESRAAVAGGITSYMEMPNCKPATVTLERLREKFALAENRSFANYSFYLGATNDNIEEIKALPKNETCGIKVFMGSSTGNMLVDDPKTLEALFSNAPTIIAAHCEDTPMIAENERLFREKYGENVPIEFHPAIRSAEACYKSSSLAVELAMKHGAKLHVLHLSTAKELELFSNAPLNDKRITVEACAHHLFFDDSGYTSKGTLIKCNPAIKTARDREALVQAVIGNKVDVIGTDHAPHTWEEKQNPYFSAPSGLPLVQDAFLSLLEHYHNGIFSLELITEKTSHAVARLFDVQDRGFIREGYWADLVLVDLEKPHAVTKENTLYHCGWSPFEGYTFKSSIAATIVSGEIAYEKGQVTASPAGKRLAFNR
ncbi:MAG: dihydroorotase [Chlorobiales bacterium]|jgi:dihydroorotase|nr:dihydroorotase [Chlorobiales bacterium]